MRSVILRLMLVALGAIVLSACGAQGTAVATLAPTASGTPDICSPDNIKGAAGAVNEFMRQYDDESVLASNVPRSQLAPHIASLQAIRRKAQDQRVPACLTELKRLQLVHMNTVINTLLAFLGGGSQSGVSQGIETARQQHDEYVLELARIMGVTPVVVTRPPTQAVTPGVAPGPGIVALNPGPFPVNLRAAPSSDADLVTTLDVGASVTALAASSDGQWYQVVVPGKADQ
ncbi:MAG TPA: SH3 domain-containing protein, partial [Anaerolineales bacterium]|nr:SH3 domain-containing protein [Anaerolineales bacterium]